LQKVQELEVQQVEATRAAAEAEFVRQQAEELRRANTPQAEHSDQKFLPAVATEPDAERKRDVDAAHRRVQAEGITATTVERSHTEGPEAQQPTEQGPVQKDETKIWKSNTLNDLEELSAERTDHEPCTGNDVPTATTAERPDHETRSGNDAPTGTTAERPDHEMCTGNDAPTATTAVSAERKPSFVAEDFLHAPAVEPERKPSFVAEDFLHAPGPNPAPVPPIALSVSVQDTKCTPPAVVAEDLVGCNGGEACAWLPASGIRLQLAEQLPQRYVFVDDAGTVHVILPIVAGHQVGAGNTWKAVSELKQFFGAAHDASRARDSAAHQLKSYGKTLEFDLWLMGRLASSSHPEYRGKDLRRSQVRLYEQAVEAASAEQEVRQALRGSQPSFPDSLSAVIAGSPNLMLLRLSPSSPQRPLGLQNPSFSLFTAPAGDRGVAAFRDALLRLMDSEFFSRAQAACAAAAAESPGVSNAEKSPFHTASEPELVTILAQSFLALISLHRCAYEGDQRNLGKLLDANASYLADSIHDALLTIQKSPEDALLGWAAKSLNAPLSAENVAALKQCFRSLTAVAATPPRPDEFLVLFDDLDGQAFAYEDCICVHFGDFLALPAEMESPRLHLRGTGSEGAAPARTAAAAFTDIRRKMAAAGTWPPPRQTESPGSAWLDIEAEALRCLFVEANTDRVAELLRSAATSQICKVPTPLYELLGSVGWEALKSLRSDWESVKGLLIDGTHGQEHLDAFSRFEGGVHTWFLVTSAMTRSFLTEAMCTGSMDKLPNVGDEVEPDELHKVLGVVGVHVEEASIRKNFMLDGHTVALATAEKQVLVAIHERHKLSMYFGPIEMRLVEDEVSRRFAADSDECYDLQGLDNMSLQTVRHPHLQDLQVRAPARMFQACVLLDIIIPCWEEIRPDGYIITVDEPATLNELESIIALSRQLKK